jgi:hypothetical protein
MTAMCCSSKILELNARLAVRKRPVPVGRIPQLLEEKSFGQAADHLRTKDRFQR